MLEFPMFCRINHLFQRTNMEKQQIASDSGYNTENDEDFECGSNTAENNDDVGLGPIDDEFAVNEDTIDPRVTDIYGAAQDECNVEGITPEEIRVILNKYAEKICKLGEDDKCVINFGQAAHLDRIFFGKSGGFWRTAYKMAYEEGDIIDDCVVGQCGLLTMAFASDECDEDCCAPRTDDEYIENKIDSKIIFINKLF